MFRIIKEYIIEPFKEGRKEAKIEEQEKNDQEEKLIDTLSYTEKFASCLAAPFRVSVFLDWFTLFKSKKEELEEKQLTHLYCFGKIAKLTDEDIKRLKEQQEKSFSIYSGEKALKVAKACLEASGIFLLSLQDVESSTSLELLYLLPEDLSALEISMASLALVSAVDTNLLEKQQVLDIFDEMIPHVQNKFKNWEDYGLQILDQEKKVEFNQGRARKAFEVDINNLIQKKNSPWNSVAWK